MKAKLSTQTRRPAVVIQNELEKLPWNRAAALLPDLTAHGVWDSSVSLSASSTTPISAFNQC